MSANTYEQVRESITTNVVATIASSIKNQHAPFMRDIKAQNFERAFNPTNGNSWEGLNSLMLDIKKAEKNIQVMNGLQLKMPHFWVLQQRKLKQLKTLGKIRLLKSNISLKKS
ncbi:Uncharacterised protein [Helicobacter cinaedi]|uniref:Uncharacterized protein n=1 Tax=Helicobacter cinaedi TaxID=213 RepID=A0A377JUW8_9HELI|nr:hypothetical protein [Helicobacter cinaedi]STP11738.1 Uncharacterised protein [Helicobacter cinaedi]